MPAGPFASLSNTSPDNFVRVKIQRAPKSPISAQLEDAREGLIEPTMFLAEADDLPSPHGFRGRVEPGPPNDLKQLVHDLDGLVNEEAAGRVPGLPISSSPVVIGLEPIKRNLRLTNVVPSDQGGDVPASTSRSR